MKLYLTGPVELPKEKYVRITKELTIRSNHVYCPHIQTSENLAPWEERKKKMSTCDRIVVIPGWRDDIEIRGDVEHSLLGWFPLYYYLPPELIEECLKTNKEGE